MKKILLKTPVYCTAFLGLSLSIYAYSQSTLLFGKPESAVYIMCWIIIALELWITDFYTRKYFTEMIIAICAAIAVIIISWKTSYILVTGKLAPASIVISLLLMTLVAILAGNFRLCRVSICFSILLIILGTFIFPAENVLEDRRDWIWYFSELLFLVLLFCRSYTLSSDGSDNERLAQHLCSIRKEAADNKARSLYAALVLCAFIYSTCVFLMHLFFTNDVPWMETILFIAFTAAALICAKDDNYCYNGALIAMICVCSMFCEYRVGSDVNLAYAVMDLFMAVLCFSGCQNIAKLFAVSELLMKGISIITFLFEPYARTYPKGILSMLIEIMQIIILILFIYADWGDMRRIEEQ